MIGFLLVLSFLAVCLAICAVSGQEDRRRRRELQERLGRVVSGPQIVKDRDRPEVLPEFCEVCGRPMSRPVGQATVTTVDGSAAVYCCSYCLALGGLDSVMSAAANDSEYPRSRMELAQPCGIFADSERASATLPGGDSPARRVFLREMTDEYRA